MDPVGQLRASDAEREDTVRHLRQHAEAGRLTVDELDERCARALSARTVGELAELVADLPAAATAPVPVASVTPAAQPLRRYGGRSFVYQWELPVSPGQAATDVLRQLAPELHRQGYELVERRADRLVFRCSHRPAWTYALAVFVFPIGLIALAHRVEEHVTVDFDPLARDRTRLVAHGRAPQGVRRAFARLIA